MTLPAKRPRFVRKVKSRLLVEMARRDFRKAPKDLAGAFRFARDYHNGTVDLEIRWMQVESEILAFLEFVQGRRPTRIIEIGTAYGGTLFLFTRVAAPDATIISVGMPGAFGGGRFGGSYAPFQEGLLRSFARDMQTVTLVRGNSHDPQTVASAAAALGDELADLLFIDGDHTIEGVRADFRDYRLLVREGGMIAFHDIVPGPEAAVGGVPDFWSEIKSEAAQQEFVEDWAQGGYGIGVLET
jgi:cephalosporin hydroxylase